MSDFTDKVPTRHEICSRSAHTAHDAEASGTSRAAETPRPASSGTSSSVSENNIAFSPEACPRGLPEPEGNQSDLSPVPVPDVPDRLSSCRTDDDRSSDGEATASTAEGVISGTIRIGRMTQPREQFTVFVNPQLRDLLARTDLPPDTIAVADAGAEFTIIDVDTHHWQAPPSSAELAAHAASITPVPDAWWTSHGGGLKLVYIGPHHADRALAAAFAAPRVFTVELLNQTRHPMATSTQHGNARCSSVAFPETDPSAPFDFRSVGNLSPDARADARAQLGLQDGQRYDHDRCPIDPGAESDARNCVIVLERGIFCHRCAHRDVRLRADLPVGCYPFTSPNGELLTELQRMAAERVHWTHALLILKHRYPHLSKAILRDGYRKVLEAHFGTGDPRIRFVFDRALGFVWGDGTWLDSEKYESTILDNDAASHLPYTLDVRLTRDGDLVARTNRARRSEAKHRSPRSYIPIRPIRGIDFGSDDSTVPVQVPPPPRHPIQLLDRPLPRDEAFEILEQFFPRIHRNYLMASIAAGICGQVKLCQPPMLIATGPSGSAKEQTIRLAARLMGQDIVKLPLILDEEKFPRNIGMALADGHCFLVFDEFGKTRDLLAKLKLILSISNTIVWRQLYAKRHTHSKFRAALFFPCVRFPDFLATSQEFMRRTRRVQLHRRVPNWGATSGGDTATWRDRTPENARVANSILTHAWRLCHDHEFLFL